MTRRQARALALDEARQAIEGITGAIEREVARKRLHACTEKLFHALLARDGVRGFRWWHRIMARRMSARCEANRAANRTCPALARMHDSMATRGLA